MIKNSLYGVEWNSCDLITRDSTDLVQEDVGQHEVSAGHEQPLPVLGQLVPEELDLEPHQTRVVRHVVNHRGGGRAVHELARGGDGREGRPGMVELNHLSLGVGMFKTSTLTKQLCGVQLVLGEASSSHRH